jgi:DNA-binding MarR family transcriptional regulator
MLKKFIDSLTNSNSNGHTKSVTTYQLSLLHSKTHRIIKQITSSALKRYKLSYVDWALLGLLYEKEELRYGSLAEELGVEPSFISVLIEGLQKKGYIREKKHHSDKRVKQIYLTKKGKELIPQVEMYLKEKLDFLFNTLAPQDMDKYVNYMATLADKIKEE